mmetsp:Transcript_3368/g.3398  ORF Transcript_3368/g.3398 Transcript_3368/m.3398 type:complete len:189 (+) Transcript_3368:23-589(+)
MLKHFLIGSLLVSSIFSVMIGDRVGRLNLDEFETSDINIDREDGVQFIKGFTKGLGLFQNVESECIFENTSIVKNLSKVYLDLYTVESISDIKTIVKDLKENFFNIAEDIKKTAQNCAGSTTAILRDATKIASMRNDYWLPYKIVANALKNSWDIIEDIREIKQTLTTVSPNESGLKLGKLFKKVLLL